MSLANDEIGRRIRTVREELGLSLRDLASACGTTDAIFGRLEAGELDPVPGDYILIAARLLKTDFRYFISDMLDDVEREARKLFRAMNQPTPKDLLALRRFMLFCMAEKELEDLLNEMRSASHIEYPRPGSGVGKLAKEQQVGALRARRGNDWALALTPSGTSSPSCGSKTSDCFATI